jgi:hypothetical protein
MVRHDRNHGVSHRSYTPYPLRAPRIGARRGNYKTSNSLAHISMTVIDREVQIGFLVWRTTAMHTASE